ncbi:DNA-binding E3 ubiquitin-protein ligase SNT2 NDAI_0I00840 [Naumovozyma dairenensis CBS 421]|uniref:PHD-type domain-containing protein n=1 Tax=Naumovozyma dairenensis (strain ATCC 10597 / BCRC 20456 / CBS 421 / NBRC 0211 / NRRL Y-12639) TaxID=1071378 RepID=G0WFU2_NAUDC|nr:hypothetical protein NDAI_0I00840 [Naumovozyma dairenensis CBS 421]CCD26653.1 hypothetical protein NDAI_0I00840 [Naumovozyma dairenensis CBS 421]
MMGSSSSQDQEQRNQPKRRPRGKEINYSEKDADQELARRLLQFEKETSRPSGSSSNSLKKPASGGNSRKSTPSNSHSNSSTNVSGTKSSKSKYQKYITDKTLSWNLIPTIPPSFRKDSRFSNVLELDDALVNIKTQVLFNDEAILLKKDETIYMVSEPPGEPYYIGRIVEFVAKQEFADLIDNGKKLTDSFPAKYFNVNMNWYYRPRDIRERMTENFDSRLVYASLHEDICPIGSYRGKCLVLHKDEWRDVLPNELETIVRPNVFFFDQLFDRFTLTYYNVLSTTKLLNTLNSRSSFLYALNKRFRFVFVEENFPLEQFLQKYVFKEKANIDLSRNMPNEERSNWDSRCYFCKEWCQGNQSLCCDECKVMAHLYCLDPPLERKPNKGIVWICFNCLKRQENTSESLALLEKEETLDKKAILDNKDKIDAIAIQKIRSNILYNKENCWFQYLGQSIVCHVYDVLDENFFAPYPFKCSRVGTRYQWTGCNNLEKWKLEPYVDGPNTDAKDRVERGDDADDTAKLLWKFDASKIKMEEFDSYLRNCKESIPDSIDVFPERCNFLDYVVTTLVECDYDTAAALKKCGSTLTRDLLKEPTFTPEELKRFEDAVRKYGGELRPVCEEVKTQPMAMIVRFFYNWKKSTRGLQVRGKSKEKIEASKKLYSLPELEGRASNGIGNESTELEVETAYRDHLRKSIVRRHDQPEYKYIDDSSFDTENLSLSNTSFVCMFCTVDYSPMWYKVTGGSDEEIIRNRIQKGVNEKVESTLKNNDDGPLGALCIRCARLWRRYAIRWQPPLDVLKKLAGTSTAAFNSSLESILEVTNINGFASSPEQAHNKHLEWELVQDSELIARQRLKAMDDRKTLLKLRRHAISFHGLLYKMVYRPFKKDEFRLDVMRTNLENFLKDIEVKTEKQKKNDMRKIKQIISLQKDTDDEEVITLPSEGSKTTTKTSKKRPLKRKIEETQDDEVKIPEVAALPQNNLELPIPLEKETQGKITVDKNFQYVQLDSNILQTLNSRRRGAGKPLPSDKKVATGNEMDNSNGDKDYTTIPYEPYIPLVLDNSNTTNVLSTYHEMTKIYGNVRPYNVLQDLNVKTRATDSSIVTEISSNIPGKTFSCSICKEQGLFNDCLECTNCGLNVHGSCYGTGPQKKENDVMLSVPNNYKWLCDPCSNDLNPIISTTYSCCLCYSKDLDYTVYKISESNACVNALKPTIDGAWCHVICALFNDDIKVQNSNKLQPICNTVSTIMKNRANKCDICQQNGGGLLQCQCCNSNVHVTCAQESNLHDLWFIREIVDSTYKLRRKIFNKETNEYYILKPAIICSNHTSPDLPGDCLKLTSVIDDIGVMQLYWRAYKETSNTNTVCNRYIEQSLWHKKSNKNESLTLSPSQVPENDYVSSNTKQCVYCSTTESIFWYRDNICHACTVLQSSKSMKKSEKDSTPQRVNFMELNAIPEDIKITLLSTNAVKDGEKN